MLNAILMFQETKPYIVLDMFIGVFIQIVQFIYNYKHYVCIVCDIMKALTACVDEKHKVLFKEPWKV